MSVVKLFLLLCISILYYLLHAEFASATTADDANGYINEISVLGNQGSTVTVYCRGAPGDISRWRHNGKDITIDGIKYRQSSNLLEIFTVVAADEGTYSCSTSADGWQDTACLYVLGKAVFASCETPLQEICRETQPLHVFVGQDIVFDSQIVYIGSGISGRGQPVMFMQLAKQTLGSRTLSLYVCSDVGSHRDMPCQSTDRIQIVQGSHKFNISMIHHSATVDDSGIYIAKAEVINPETGATAFITKTFEVVVDVFPVELTIQHIGILVAREPYTLQCIVELTENVQEVLVQWVDSSGNSAADKIGVHEEMMAVSETSLILTLTFDALKVSDSGNYTCLATFTPLSVDVSYTVRQTESVDVQATETQTVEVSQVRVAVVNATAVEVSWEFTTSPGQSVSEFIIYYTAVKGGKVIHSSSEIVSGEMTSKILMITYLTSGIQLEHRFQVAGIVITSEGDFVEGDKSEVAATFLDEALFQLRIGPLAHCGTWDLAITRRFEQAIRKEVSEVLSELCNCNIPISFIREGKFSCRSSYTQVTYRSTIVGTGSHSSNVLQGMLQKWVESSPVISADLFIVNVDANCSVAISSLYDPECSHSPDTTYTNGTALTGPSVVVAQCITTCLDKLGWDAP